MAIVKWDKKYTETLAETLKRFRLENPKYKNEKITYAGRLDPMAEGLILLLTGSDVHKKEDFLKLDKVYEIDFVFGPETDTYDILGLCNNNSQELKNVNDELLKNELIRHVGKFEQKYPPFSSKPVNGKPLFMWARENRLDEIKIPKKQIEIFSIKYLEKKKFSFQEIKKLFIENVKNVKGDFRQSKIVDKWNEYFKKFDLTNEIFIYTITASASSGSYMRTLIDEIGHSLGVPACTVKINRKQVGEYRL